MTDYPYTWRWRRHADPHRPPGERMIAHPFADRVSSHRGHCRVLARGAMNSALIEFTDGTRAVVSRNALARR